MAALKPPAAPAAFLFGPNVTELMRLLCQRSHDWQTSKIRYRVSSSRPEAYSFLKGGCGKRFAWLNFQSLLPSCNRFAALAGLSQRIPQMNMRGREVKVFKE
jgi:hypothetical protein